MQLLQFLHHYIDLRWLLTRVWAHILDSQLLHCSRQWLKDAGLIRKYTKHTHAEDFLLLILLKLIGQVYLLSLLLQLWLLTLR